MNGANEPAGAPALATVPLLLALLLIFASTASGATQTSTLAPGGASALDRVAYAVDGAESSHGADSAMWRPDPDGPQGPMQVSAAAAADAGGGDRLDLRQNRALGRAYLARMYRRYGSWGDAIAAYNWGPGRMDGWISDGRASDRFPQAVTRYRMRVMAASGLYGLPGEILEESGRRLVQRGIVHMQPRRPAADRARRGNGRDEVELLYIRIMRSTDPKGR